MTSHSSPQIVKLTHLAVPARATDSQTKLTLQIPLIMPLCASISHPITILLEINRTLRIQCIDWQDHFYDMCAKVALFKNYLDICGFVGLDFVSLGIAFPEL